MEVKIALLGTEKSLITNAGYNIESILKSQFDNIYISLFVDSNLLINDILSFDIIAISDEIFSVELPRLQEIILKYPQSIEKGSRIVLTNLKHPLKKSTVEKWAQQLEINGEIISIPIKKGLKDERARDIVYFEYLNRKVYVRTSRNYYETSLKSIKEAKEKVGNLNYFEIPYVSYVVNLLWVESIQSRDILMKDGNFIPLSQKKAHLFRRTFKGFLSSLH
ncbi:LytTR family DNA-binding domain-containing protein [Alkalihalobacillus pseudalcaliphilus]|uniref:LytTR family DNA-binding domain-containing protein n=1 Tax=Alkalihalobacillus pseudalcaliphilus TaxID=79884 RepID=UPI00069F21A3|nr:LytTR family DNA-binding domain-containing protein [Alkalihalobacillus pseudalcaliphilus]